MNVASITAIIGLTILGTVAMITHTDGILLAGICTIIGGLGGFAVKRKVLKQ